MVTRACVKLGDRATGSLLTGVLLLGCVGHQRTCGGVACVYGLVRQQGICKCAARSAMILSMSS